MYLFQASCINWDQTRSDGFSKQFIDVAGYMMKWTFSFYAMRIKLKWVYFFERGVKVLMKMCVDKNDKNPLKNEKKEHKLDK